MNKEANADKNCEIVLQEAIPNPLTDEEKAELLEKVSKKLEGKMIQMTDEEIEDFYDTRGF